MYKEHPGFQLPDDKTKIWRYFDFAKFISLIMTSNLVFPSAGILVKNDPFEGSYARGNIIYDPTKDPSLSMHPQKVLEILSQSMKKMRDWGKNNTRKFTYINCWHINEHESMAMWKCYASNNYGIAIQSTIEKLKNSIQDDKEIYIGEVSYIDHNDSNYHISELYITNNFLYKRKSFAHERELRAIYLALEEFLRNPKAILPEVISVPVSIDKLIETIYVSPEMPDWVKELIELILKKHKLEKDVRKSDLCAETEGLW